MEKTQSSHPGRVQTEGPGMVAQDDTIPALQQRAKETETGSCEVC